MRGVLTVLHLVNSPASTFRPSMTISPAITALVVAMTGIMFPAMAEGEGRGGGERGRGEVGGERGRGERGRGEGGGGESLTSCTTVPPPHTHTHHCWKMVAHSCIVHTLWSG